MENSRITHLADRLGLGVDTVARLVALEQEASGEPVTAGEIATKLRLTSASGRRIIRLLKEFDVVSHSGTTHTSGPGRPTNTYVLKLTESLAREGD
jgi:predicted ArsR family transcriptional regulator